MNHRGERSADLLENAIRAVTAVGSRTDGVMHERIQAQTVEEMSPEEVSSIGEVEGLLVGGGSLESGMFLPIIDGPPSVEGGWLPGTTVTSSGGGVPDRREIIDLDPVDGAVASRDDLLPRADRQVYVRSTPPRGR